MGSLPFDMALEKRYYWTVFGDVQIVASAAPNAVTQNTARGGRGAYRRNMFLTQNHLVYLNSPKSLTCYISK